MSNTLMVPSEVLQALAYNYVTGVALFFGPWSLEVTAE